jgi:urease accessory protein UreH
VPDHLIPSPGARLRQRTTLRLAPGATALVLDAWCTGRPARAEAFAFAELDLALVAADERGPLLIERARLAGDARWARLGAAEGRPYVATFAALAPGRDDWDAAVAELAAALDATAGSRPGLAAGVTPLSRGGLLARILAPSAPLLERATRIVWDVCRRRLLDRPPLSLRRP